MRAITNTVIIVALLCWAAIPAMPQTRESKAAGTGSITGRVTLKDQPMPGVAVALLPENTGPRMTPLAKAVTDAEGRYRFTDLAAGRYRVSPLAPGYISPSGNNSFDPGKTVRVEDGEEIEGMDFALRRGGVITGRVTRADGQPLIEAHVSPLKIDERGQENFYSSSNYHMYLTDDRGVYRLYGLPAGRYKVSVGVAANSGMVRMGAGAAANSYLQTFHPDVTDESRATIIELTEGGEATGIDITVGSTLKTYKARGRIVDAETGAPVPNALYGYGALMDGNHMGGVGITGNRTNARGEFFIEGVLPGRYAVFVWHQGESDYYSEPAPFEIKDVDVSGVEVKVRRGASIIGSIIFEGGGEPPALSELHLAARPMEGGPRIYRPYQPPFIAPDGSFRLSGLPPGKVMLQIYGGPERSFWRLRVERDGVEQRDGIELKAGEQVTGVRVVLSLGTGVVRGQVRFENGTPPAGAQMYAEVHEVRPTGESTPLGGSPVDAKGRFVIEGLVSGEYEIRLIIWSQDGPAQRRPAAQKVEVTDGAVSQVTLVVNLAEKEKER
ncbi:MAG TPA: carboxypeptidase-like regulatory domain-containing protein [Blastocatellia bacterium]|nr:carboxypeptidase-like regulatory domain-containing protein [Blastocatellia bacterium]